MIKKVYKVYTKGQKHFEIYYLENNKIKSIEIFGNCVKTLDGKVNFLKNKPKLPSNTELKQSLEKQKILD